MKYIFILLIFAFNYSNAQIDTSHIRKDSGDINVRAALSWILKQVNAIQAVSGFSGNYNDLTNKPTIPTTFNQLTGVVPFANGGISGSTATSATTGAMTVNMTSEIITITPTGSCTFNASGGVAGQRVTFIISTSGTSAFTLTWSSNFKAVGTLSTGTSNNKKFCVSFLYDGSIWIETGRTAAM